MENIITQDQRHFVVADKFLADDKRLRQAIRTRLHGVFQRNTPLRTIAQQPLKTSLILRRGDDQNLANPRLHQRGQRVINHRFVVNRHQLFADGFGNRPQARA